MERQKDRKTERQKDRKTEPWKDRRAEMWMIDKKTEIDIRKIRPGHRKIQDHK